MRYTKFLLLAILFFSFSASLAFAKPKAVVSHGIYNLGEISEDKVYKRSFFIENVGDELLKAKFEVSCGCIKIISPKETTIEPSKRTEVKFSVDPKGYRGSLKKTIYIKTNDPDNKTINLVVTAQVLINPGNIIRRFMLFRPGVIMLSGLSDGINPCAFTVLVFFISFLGLVGYTRTQMFFVGISFILAVFLTYVLIGFGIFEFVRRIAIFESLSKIIYLGVAFFSLILGGLSIYDFWVYKKTKDTSKILLQLPGLVKQKIHQTIRLRADLRSKTSEERKLTKLISSALACGFIVSLFESVCTGQLYLPTIAYIFKTTPLKLKAFMFLILYNLMFIVPLLLIFRLSFIGMTSLDFANIAKKHLSGVKLVMGIIFLLLGAILIIIKS